MDTDYPDLGLSSSPQTVNNTQSEYPDLGLSKQSKDQEAGFGERMLYGFKTMPSFSEGVGDYLERRFPLGRIQFYTPGEGWHTPQYVEPPTAVVEAARSHNYELAKEIMDKKDQYEVESMAPFASAQPEKGGAAEVMGNIAAALLDPTSLIPVAQGAKMAYATGGAIGAADAAAYSLSTDDEIDPVLTAVGFTGGVIGTAGIRYVGGKMSRFMQATDRRSAEGLAGQFELRVSDFRAKGMTTQEAFSAAKADMNLNEDALAGLTMKIGRQLDFRRSKAETDLVVEQAKQALRDTTNKFKISDKFSGVSKVVDDYLGNVSTRIKNISPAVWARLRRLDFAEHHNTHEYFKKVQPFMDDLDKLKSTDKQAYRQLHKALLNQDKIAAERIISKMDTKAGENYKVVRGILDDVGSQLKDVGYKMDLLEDFYPRVIMDVSKLMKSLPSETRAMIEKNMPKGASLDDMGVYINKYLRGRMTGAQIDQVLGTTKARQIETVTDMILDHYAEPKAALHTYLRRTVHDVERRKFFGRAAINTDNGADIKVADSVGNLIAEGRQSGEIAAESLEELRDLLVARFDLGNRSGYGILQDARNIIYMSTIGNPVSALTQIGDLGVSAFAHGLRNTMAAVFGRKALRIADLGITDIAQEFASTRKMAKAMDWVFEKSGFKWVDYVGKNTSINAAFRKWGKMVHTPKGVESLRQKWGLVFGEEFDDLVSDLANKRVSENVKLLLFNELADLQPITLSEMPLKYLQNPNGRIFYMLKTFTLKQLDIMRRNIWQEFNKGNKAVAVRNAAKYLGVVSAFNLGAEISKEALLTKDFDVEAVPDMVVSNLFKNFGASEYLLNKYGSKGQIGTMLGEMVAPPLNVVDSVAGVFIDPENMEQHIKNMPMIGKFWYYYMGDGIENLQKRREQKRSARFRESFDVGGLD